MSAPKLLIITQAVDIHDPILGFFHRWLELFAAASPEINVVCLRKGEYSLPANVHVHSLGKEKGGNKILYVTRFLRFAWSLRRQYDAVFVHMNPEYVVLGGPLWLLLRKPVGLWYVHKSVTIYLLVASLFVRHIFSASRESIRIRSSKIRVTGHGIDTEFFTRDSRHGKEHGGVLSAGRLSEVKGNDFIIRSLVHMKGDVSLEIVGDAVTTEDVQHKSKLEELTRQLGLGNRVTFSGALGRAAMRDAYLRARVFAHASDTGSIDKVVLEALACGLPVVTTSDVFSKIHAPILMSSRNPEQFAKCLESFMNDSEKSDTRVRYVRDNHSLKNLVATILQYLET